MAAVVQGRRQEVFLDPLLLTNPIFWTRKKAREFLCALSDTLLVNKEAQRLAPKYHLVLDEDTTNKVAVITVFDALLGEVVAGGGTPNNNCNWIDMLDGDVRMFFTHKTRPNTNITMYNGRELFDLLRAVRNLTHHMFENYAEFWTEYLARDLGLDRFTGRVPECPRARHNLRPYFGLTPDDTMAYWLHKFPRLLPLCHAFAQQYKLIPNDKYFVEDGTEVPFPIGATSHPWGIVGQVKSRLESYNKYDQFLRQYKFIQGASESLLTIFKGDPWALGEHEIVSLCYSGSDDSATLKKTLDIKDCFRGGTGTTTCGPCPDCSQHIIVGENDDGTKLLWKDDTTTIAAPHGHPLPIPADNPARGGTILSRPDLHPANDNLLVVLCNRVEDGIKTAYSNPSSVCSYVVIFTTRDNHVEAARWVNQFQATRELTSTTPGQFQEIELEWEQLDAEYRAQLLSRPVLIQNNEETIENLLGSRTTEINIMNKADTNFLLNLIHSGERRDLGAPEVIRDFGSLSAAASVVEISRRLNPNETLSMSALMLNGDEGEEFHPGPPSDAPEVFTERSLLVSNPKLLHRVISGPSGLGKTTMLKRVAKDLIAAHCGISTPTHKLIAFLRFPELITRLNVVNWTDVDGAGERQIGGVIAESIAKYPICSELLAPIVAGEYYGLENDNTNNSKYSMVLLLDAIDEVGDQRQLNLCLQFLQVVLTKFLHITVYITTRSTSNNNNNIIHASVMDTFARAREYLVGLPPRTQGRTTATSQNQEANLLARFENVIPDASTQGYLDLSPLADTQICEFLVNCCLNQSCPKERRNNAELENTYRGFAENWMRFVQREEDWTLFHVPFWLAMLAQVVTTTTPDPDPNAESQVGTVEQLLNKFISSSMTPHYSKSYRNGDNNDGMKLSMLVRTQEIFAVHHPHHQPNNHNIFQITMS